MKRGPSESYMNVLTMDGETILTTKKAGSFVGHAGIVGESREWSHSVKAKTYVTVLVLRKEKLDK